MSRLLVPLVGTDVDADASRLAFRIAAQMNWFVEGFHARSSLTHIMPAMGEGYAVGMMAQFSEAATETLDAQARNAEEVFAAAARAANAPLAADPADGLRFAGRYTQEEGHPADLIARRSRLSDVTVFTTTGRADSFTLGDAMIDVLLAERQPVLLLQPDAAYDATAPVLIAWDGSAEAAAAVRAARPFLAKAREVVVAQVEDDIETGERALADCRNIVEYLALSGIGVRVEKVARDGQTTAAALYDCAKGCAAALVVMGAYGHGRLRERLLGGVTVRMIDAAPGPLFLAH
ncbi:MAG: universal stress protein [Pseudomonadota bacterium]